MRNFLKYFFPLKISLFPYAFKGNFVGYQILRLFSLYLFKDTILLFLMSFLFSAGVWTQGFMLARQILPSKILSWCLLLKINVSHYFCCYSSENNMFFILAPFKIFLFSACWLCCIGVWISLHLFCMAFLISLRSLKDDFKWFQKINC
jgi:hypothetical protein